MKPSTLVIREVFKSTSKDERDKKLMESIINILQRDNDRGREQSERE